MLRALKWTLIIVQNPLRTLPRQTANLRMDAKSSGFLGASETSSSTLHVEG